MGGGGSSPARLPATGTTETTSLEDTSFKTVRLSNEERKEKIHRYIKKRNERNFSKKIKVRQELPNYSNSNSKYHPPPPTHISNEFHLTADHVTDISDFFFKKKICSTLAEKPSRIAGLASVVGSPRTTTTARHPGRSARRITKSMNKL